MKKNENNGIEFEAWDANEELSQISRKSFRTPIDESDNISLQINDCSFRIVNLTPTGIGIHIEGPDVFSVGQMIHTITLHLKSTLLSFQGKVCHISPMDPDGFLCGIEWIGSLEEKERRLRQFIRKKLNNLTTDGVAEPPG